MLQEDKKLMPSIKKLFYIVMSLKDERNPHQKQGCHLWKFYKASDFFFEKLKQLFVNYHQKLFVIYVNGESIFWKVGLIANCFNHLCQQAKAGLMVWVSWFGRS
jgi:hypothetical protein